MNMFPTVMADSIDMFGEETVRCPNSVVELVSGGFCPSGCTIGCLL